MYNIGFVGCGVIISNVHMTVYLLSKNFFCLWGGGGGGELIFLGAPEQKHCLHLPDITDITVVITQSIQHNTVHTFIITDGHSS